MKRLLVLMLTGMILTGLPTSALLAETRIRCSSGTTIQNSGLSDYLLPLIEKKIGIKVDLVAVGTMAAIEIAKRGDADVVITHDQEQERKAMAEGYLINRQELMYNEFILIGQANDPLGIKQSKTITEAFARIAEKEYPFISRGDGSGTHARELFIWKKTAIEPKGKRWYLEVGQGQEKTQRIANEKRAYALTDRGTWLATREKDKLDMTIVFEGDPLLKNQYAVLAINPAKHKHVKYKEAMMFINWLISKEGQQIIGAFKDKNGNPLFIPNASQGR